MEVPVEKGHGWVVLSTTPTCPVGLCSCWRTNHGSLWGKHNCGGKQGSLGVCQSWIQEWPCASSGGVERHGGDRVGHVLFGWHRDPCAQAVWDRDRQQMGCLALSFLTSIISRGLWPAESVWDEQTARIWSSSWDAQSGICHGQDLPLLSAPERG